MGEIKKGEYEAAWQEGFIFTNYRFDYDNDVMHNKFSESAFRIKDDVLEIVLNFSYEKGGNFKYDDIDMDMLNDILDAYNIEVGLDRKLTHDWDTKGLCILEIHYYRNKVKKEGSEK